MIWTELWDKNESPFPEGGGHPSPRKSPGTRPQRRNRPQKKPQGQPGQRLIRKGGTASRVLGDGALKKTSTQNLVCKAKKADLGEANASYEWLTQPPSTKKKADSEAAELEGT